MMNTDQHLHHSNLVQTSLQLFAEKEENINIHTI